MLNSYFKKDKEKQITYKSGDAETQLDLILMRQKSGAVIRDCAAIPGEAFLTQHRAVRAKICIRNYRKKEKRLKKRLKTWKLKNEESRRQFEQTFADRVGNTESRTWNTIQQELYSAARQVCGMTTGRRGRERQTWWWNEEVQVVIKEKKKAYKIWQRTKTGIDKINYQIARGEARRSVARAKKQAWIDWSSNLNTPEGRNKMFRIAAQMKKDKTDIQGTNCIRDRDGGIEIREEAVREVWRKYFEDLLNVENENEVEEELQVEGPIDEISYEEVKDALQGMKNRKAAGPSGVTTDLFKFAGSTGIEELCNIFNNVVHTGECPQQWSESLTVALYKGKGDPLECNKYRGLRLLEHGMKIFEKVLDRRLRMLVTIGDGQCGFMPGKSCTDAIFIIRRLQEKYMEKKKSLFHIFVDLEKAFDRVPRTLIEWALRRQQVPETCAAGYVPLCWL